jgi:hypothetical protein
MGTPFVVRRAEQVPAAERDATNPLYFGDLLLYPNLGDPVSKATKELGFYFTVYPSKGPAPEATLQFLLNGAPIAQVPLPLDAADASGRIQQLGRLPLDRIAAGLYELRAVVTGPIWFSTNVSPDTVLETYSALWHIDRRSLSVTASDILEGEDGTIDIGEDKSIYDRFSLSYGQPPLVSAEVNGQARRVLRTSCRHGASDAGDRSPVPTEITLS